MGSGEITINIRTNNFRSAVKEVDKLGKTVKIAKANITALDKGVGSLGNRLGFVAFQMTFLAGVAGRALGEVTQRLNTLVQDGSKDLSTIARAITRSGFDISASSGEAREAVDLLNNAMRTFGSGTTIFNTQEVAGAFDAVGRAVTFSGTALERAKKQIVATQQVLRLMTIEEQDADSAAINFVKTMKLFNVGITEAARVSDVLVQVNNQSTITLDGLVRSLGFAGQQAQAFGLTFEETAATLGVIQDRLGVLNGGPGRNFSILLQNLASTGTSLNADLAAFGIQIRDNSGQLKGIVDIVGQFNRALKNAGKEGSLARQQILELVNATSRGERTLLTLVEGFDELELSIKAAEGASGIAERMATAFEQLPAERIARLKNAFNSLRVELVGAMSPAIEELTTVMRDLITDTNIQEFMKEVGTTLAQTVVPALKSLVKIFKGFATILRKNEVLLKVVVGGFTALLGVLVSLFVIGTVGALFAAFASVIERVINSSITLKIATNALFGAFLKFAVAAFGIFLILKGIDQIIGIVKDGIEATEVPALAAAAALTALGVAMTLLPFKLKGIGTAFASGGVIGAIKSGATQIAALIGGALGGVLGSFKALPGKISDLGLKGTISSIGKGIGGGFKGALLGAMSGLRGGLSALLAAATAHPVAAVIVAGIIIGTALGLAIRQAIQDQEDFGFNSAGEAIVSNWAVALAKMLVGFNKWKADTEEKLASLISGFSSFFNNILNMEWSELGDKINEQVFGPIKQSLLDAHAAFGKFGDAFGDPEAFLKTEGLDRLEKLLKKQVESDFGIQALAQSGSFTGQEASVQNLLQGSETFRRWAEEFGAHVTPQDIANTIREFEIPIQSLSAAIPDAGAEWLRQRDALENGTATFEDYLAIMSTVKQGYMNNDLANQEAILTTQNLNEVVASQAEKHSEVIEAVQNQSELANTLASDTEQNIASTKELTENITSLNTEDVKLIANTKANDVGLKDLTLKEKLLNDHVVKQTKSTLTNEQILIGINSMLNTGFIPQTLRLITELFNTTNVMMEVQTAADIAKEAFLDLARRLDAFTPSGGGGGSGSNNFSGGREGGAVTGSLHGAFGGIINRRTSLIAGEAGPEALIPLSRLEGNGGSIGGNTIINNITINADEIPDGASASELADMIAERINRNIPNKQSVII